METAVILLFIFLLFFVFLYSLAQLNLLFLYYQSKKSPEKDEKFTFQTTADYPFITIQLPIYNEKNVLRRLLQNISEIEYPDSKLEIQVLDDSTDDSVNLSSQLIADLNCSRDIFKHLQRENRVAFKAGALKEGLKSAKGEFIAVFDADFLPSKDWLQKTIPYFKNEKIGAVQTRWGHLNRNYSLLTKIQAFALDFHFFLEQNGRSYGKHFINFNGTAGIWRKICILDAGNWAGDTLTEDLDLSYRAQLKTWKIKYLEELETPAELPITIAAARSQQFRWNKGAAENFQKTYRKLLHNNTISLGTKIHGFFHLLNSSLFLVILLLGILSVPVLFITSNPPFHDFLIIISVLSMGSLFFFLCYWVSYQRIYENKFNAFINFIPTFFAFFSIAMGFSLHNSVAVLEGHFGKKSAFIRTPKFNLSEMGKPKKVKVNRIVPKLSTSLWAEFFLMLLFAFGIFSAFSLHNFSFLIFHIMLFLGFGFMVFKTLFKEF